MYNVAFDVLRLIKKRGERENNINMLGSQQDVKKILLYTETLFQGHVGPIGSRGAVGPQGPPVSLYMSSEYIGILLYSVLLVFICFC